MEILQQFGVQPILLAAQVVNFFILLFILKKLLYKPILKILEERKKRIEDSLKNAEEIERRLQQTQEESERIMAKTLAEAKKILDQTNEQVAQIMEDAQHKRDAILNQASEDAKRIYITEKEKLMTEVRENLSGLVLSVIQKVTGKILSKKDQKDMIDKHIRNIS